METLVALKYPNGRIHTTSIVTDAEVRPGHEFELHGRRWRATKLAPATRVPSGHPVRVLCVPIITSSPPP
jgi:hypothetical protein